MREEEEIQNKLRDIRRTRFGSYEELAGTEAALCWVLGDNIELMPREPDNQKVDRVIKNQKLYNPNAPDRN